MKMSFIKRKDYTAISFRKYFWRSLLVLFYVVLVLLGSPLLPALFTVILMMFYLLVRNIEFCTYWTIWSRTGDALATLITNISLLGIVTSWIGWLIVKKVHGLAHHVLLEIELIKWVRLCLIYLAFSQALMFPRHAILAQVREVIKHKTKIIRLCQGFLGIYECTVFIFGQLAVMKYAPEWRSHDALGFYSWKLVQKFVLLLLGVVSIKTTIRLLVLILQFTYEDRQYVVYFAKGMRTSIDMVCISTLWIIVWHSYFRPRFNRRDVFKDRVLDIVDWSFFCFAIGTVLWLLKRFVVLKWEARVLYNRFRIKILQASMQFHLLILLLKGDEATHKFSFWTHLEEAKTKKQKVKVDAPWVEMVMKKFMMYLLDKKHSSAKDCNNENNDGNDHEDNNRLDVPERIQRSAKEIFVQLEEFTISTHKLRRSLEHFVKEEKQYIPMLENSIFQKIKKSFDESEIDSRQTLKDTLKGVSKTDLEDFHAETLYAQIRNVHSKEVVKGADFEKWAEKAFRNYTELCKSIKSAQEAAIYLDRLLGGFFVVVVITIWLLVTKTAKTDLLVLISSPILAATFIFGDTCKNIFEGILFAFVIRLFDIGDMCVIDGIQMEVNRIGIWNTTFLRVDTKEEMTYQNSSLQGTVITKRKQDSNLNDHVEYYIDMSLCDSSYFDSIKLHINKCLKELECHEHPRGVLVTEVRDKVKIVVHFKHQYGLQDMIHHECYKKQSKTRAKLLLSVYKHIDELNSGSTS